MILANVLMLVGGIVWLTGELIGVVRNRSRSPGGLPDTTSGWVWLAERKWPAARIVVAAGLIVLGAHFLIH